MGSVSGARRCEGTLPARFHLPVKKDVIRFYIWRRGANHKVKFAHQCWPRVLKNFCLQRPSRFQHWWANFTLWCWLAFSARVDLITNFFHGHGQNHTSRKRGCKLILIFWWIRVSSVCLAGHIATSPCTFLFGRAPRRDRPEGLSIAARASCIHLLVGLSSHVLRSVAYCSKVEVCAVTVAAPMSEVSHTAPKADDLTCWHLSNIL